MDYRESRKKTNIKPIKLDNVQSYYFDIMNIEHSFTGRMDANSANTFIMESAQLLLNSIELFELGYFDCAYYSLREAIEISTINAYLFDKLVDSENKNLEAWKKPSEYFPMQKQMIKQLEEYGNQIADMKDKMPDFFDDIVSISKLINKYVHKQGFRHLYVSRNHPLKSYVDSTNFINFFEYFLKKCIGIVAVMRLLLTLFHYCLLMRKYY